MSARAPGWRPSGARTSSIFDGSGAAIPPIATDSSGARRRAGPRSLAHLNPYRRLISDLVVAVGCEVEGAIARDASPAGTRATHRARRGLHGRATPMSGTSTPRSFTSRRNLANRAALEAELRTLEADTYLVELKGAAIDVVAEHALAPGDGSCPRRTTSSRRASTRRCSRWPPKPSAPDAAALPRRSRQPDRLPYSKADGAGLIKAGDRTSSRTRWPPGSSRSGRARRSRSRSRARSPEVPPTGALGCGATRLRS